MPSNELKIDQTIQGGILIKRIRYAFDVLFSDLLMNAHGVLQKLAYTTLTFFLDYKTSFELENCHV